MVDILIFREKGEATEPRTERQDQFIWQPAVWDIFTQSELMQ